MAYVTPIYGGSAAQIDYRLGIGAHGCDSDARFSYRADGRERPLRWIGGGLAEFGVDGLTAGAELTAEQHELARVLLAGRQPVTGEQLVAPKLAVPADAKVPLGPLVAAVCALAAERGMDDPAALFATPKQRSAWNTAVRAVTRRGDAALLRVDDALKLVEVAGLDAEQVWPDVDLLATYSNLYTPLAVVDEDGAPVRNEDGSVKVELAPRRVPVGIVGFDIGVTLPKSASLLLAFLPDDLVDQVEAGYTEAIERTFGWVEGRTSYVRRGKHGDGHTARHEPTAGFAGWVMTHRAARPVGDRVVGDPHWHVHITVANMAKAADGTWLTVAAGGRDLMRHAPAIDKVTQAQVRGFLHDRFGITFTRRDRSGVWEVAQIPDRAIVYFSKRGQQVSAVLEQLGYSNADVSAAQARILTRTSRSTKPETTAASDTTLRGLWRADAATGGLDPDALMDQVLTHTDDASAQAGDEVEAQFGIGLDDLVRTLTDPEHGLTAHARRFSHLDAVAAVADALPYGAGIAEVERLTDRALAHPAFVSLPAAGEAEPAETGLGVVGGPGIRSPLGGAHQMAGGQLFTTRDVTDAERIILAHATTDTTRATAPETAQEPAGESVRVAAGTVELAVTVVEAAQGFPLSAEQRAVLARVVTTGRQVEAIEGPPGTGKTTLMRAARVAWEAAGYRVSGAATAAVAAQNLAAESGIASRTLAQWLWRIQHGDSPGAGLDGVDVLVLDEANLTSDRDRAALYTAAAVSGTKIVEVGDPRQLRGVGEGSMFGYLHQLLDGPRLTENRRQRDTDERAALAAFRDGRHAEALHTWARIGGVVATETGDEAVSAMVTSWLRLRDGVPDPHTLTAGLVMLAATNEQVTRINDATQAVRHARGELGDGATYQLPAGRQARFHVGDLVLIRRNDRHQQAVTGQPVLNGYRGVVTAITPAGVEVTWHADDSQPATQPAAQSAGEPAAEPSVAVLSPAYIAQGGLELGYALTAHKAEGLTVNGQWTRPDSTRNDGTVLVYGPGMDNPGLYVSLSRDKGQAVLFGARAELEGDREDLIYGPPADQRALTDRVIAALAEHAAATATTANDRPVLVDLGQAPADPSATTDSPSTGAGVDPGTGTGTGRPVPAPAAAQPDQTQPQPWPEPGRDRPPVPVPEPVSVTDEQRELWRDLARRFVAARRAGDQDTVRSIQDERRVVAEQLGPDRVAALWQETHDKARQRLERLRDTARWQNRVHSRLTDTELGRAIRHTERQHADHLAAAERARTQYAEREPAVAAGRGPRVTELREQLDHFRVNAERQGTVEQLERRWRALNAQVGDAAERAAVKEFDAERTRWWQTGRQQQLRAEAAADRAFVEHTAAKAKELAEHAAELQRQLGGPGQWQLARERAERAERTYDHGREHAHKADQAELAQLRDRAVGHDTAAADARTRHTELRAEQQLRAIMPDTQLALEHQLRTQAAEQQQLDHTESAHQLARSLHPDLQPDLQTGLHYDLHHEVAHEVHRHIEQDIDRGHSPGL
jgi:conjugative relaxase-like TrwC/TraI family protein